MNYHKKTDLKYPSVNEFKFMIKKSKLNKKSHINGIDLHSHLELELYINLTGDVSFLVENKLYPVTRGDIIISRPGEYHHCVYNSDKEHNFFWILIDIEENKEIFDFFLDITHSNLISPYIKAKEEIIEVCNILLNNGLTSFDRYYYLFRLITLREWGIDSYVDYCHYTANAFECLGERVAEFLKNYL